MPLRIERGSYGSISIVRCTGAMVVGDGLGKLEEDLLKGVTDADRVVLDLKGVDRIDSTGMGLLVRHLSRARAKGGDLRLCSPSLFVRKLLSATKLDTVFLVYTSDYNAIASFFVRGAPSAERGEPMATVLFVDPSEDLCAFARSVLAQHRYEVVTTNNFNDGYLLAQAVQPNIIVVGYETAGLEGCAVVPTLQSAAPNAGMVTLPADFGKSYANEGAAALVKAVGQKLPMRSM